MDFTFTPEQEKLRQDIRVFLTSELGTGRIAVDTQNRPSKEFSKKLAARGWIGMTWPREYGGPGASYIDRLIVTEELLRFGAPAGYHWPGDRQVGPALMRFGSEELKQEFLPKILNADVMFCLLFSEPNAGSDLASVQCQAVEDGDEFVINGQKIWSSYAHHAEYGWLVANSDPSAPKHRNISQFIIDMKKPGVTLRPIVDASGEHHFNETFFDNYRVPRRYLVGEKNRGWRQIAAQVDFERSGIERLMSNWMIFEGLVRYVKQRSAAGNPLRNLAFVRDKLADLKVQFEVGRWLIYRVAWLLDSGKIPNFESALAKLYGTSFKQHLSNACVDILGLSGLLRPGSKWAPLEGEVAWSYMRSISYTIGGGANEVLRNIIALRGLGMPSA